jgi:CTP:molybdopterin cytidylyltransferase MocA
VTTLGLLLAAGAGRRMGTPKALLREADGVPFVTRAVAVLVDGGCDSVLVVTGARADEAAALVTGTGPGAEPDEAPPVSVVVAEDWDEGMGASLRAGLAAASAGDASCAMVTLVDLPDVGADVVRRLLQSGRSGPQTLVRAAYDGVPGHPVLLGRDHWAGVLGSARGDKGARDYLKVHRPALVECGDLASGRDVDRPDQLG